MTRGAIILVGDSDPIWVGSMTRLLETEGYRVLSSRTGVDALYQVRMRRPDLRLFNPHLPQMSGWEVCRRLKRMPDQARTKVVMLTLDGEAAHRVGADGYLMKAGQVEPALPPIRVFRYPAQGILGELLQRHALAACNISILLL